MKNKEKEFIEKLKIAKIYFPSLSYWDPDKYNWDDLSWTLCDYFHEYFYIWWDPKRFNWEHSTSLSAACNKYLNIWWDSDLYNWKSDKSSNLVLYCSKYFETWWDPNKWNWEESAALVQWANSYFEIWWDSEQFVWDKYSWTLPIYCSKYINIWFDFNKIKYFDVSEILLNCSKYMSNDLKKELMLKLG